MDSTLWPYAFTAILGGGLFKAIEALIKAIQQFKEKKTRSAIMGAKTPSEIESVSIATMTSALLSAQGRITALEQERLADAKYYKIRINELQAKVTVMEETIIRLLDVDEKNNTTIRTARKETT